MAGAVSHDGIKPTNLEPSTQLRSILQLIQSHACVIHTGLQSRHITGYAQMGY